MEINAAAKKDVLRLLRSLYGLYGRAESSPGNDPVGGLIATILSQNTSDTNSRRAYESLKNTYPSWDAAADAPAAGIEKAIQSGGLAKIKAPRIKNILTQIRKDRGRMELNHLRKMDTDHVLAELLKFPGVGLKTAACVALFELGRDLCPVDTHVHRIVRRFGWVPQKSNADKCFYLLRRIIPEGHGLSAHIALIRHGRNICRPKPKCDKCPLFNLCPYDK